MECRSASSRDPTVDNRTCSLWVATSARVLATSRVYEFNCAEMIPSHSDAWKGCFSLSSTGSDPYGWGIVKGVIDAVTAKRRPNAGNMLWEGGRIAGAACHRL